MEGILLRGWEFILFVCGGTSTLAKRATLAARWLHERQPISNQPGWGWGFHTVRSGINPGDLRFRPRVVGVVDIYGRISDLGMGPYPPCE